MTKESKKFEKRREPFNIEIKNAEGVLRFLEANKEGETLVEIENNEGKKIVLNDLLDELEEDWIIENRTAQTTTDAGKPIIYINTYEVRGEGWQYLLSLLHEIGHATIKESTPEQRAIYEEFNTMKKTPKYVKENKVAMQRLNTLHSKIERDAWAYAIRKLKNILEELDMDIKNIFSSTQELKDYVHELLLSYKEWGKVEIKNMPIPKKDREELFEQIDKLYTHKQPIANSK